MTTLYFLSGGCLATEVDDSDLIRGLTGEREFLIEERLVSRHWGFLLEEGTDLWDELSSDLREDSSVVRDETAYFKAAISFF